MGGRSKRMGVSRRIYAGKKDAGTNHNRHTRTLRQHRHGQDRAENLPASVPLLFSTTDDQQTDNDAGKFDDNSEGH